MVKSFSKRDKVRIICLMAEIKALELLMNDVQEEIKALGESGRGQDGYGSLSGSLLIQLSRNHQRKLNILDRMT